MNSKYLRPLFLYFRKHSAHTDKWKIYFEYVSKKHRPIFTRGVVNIFSKIHTRRYTVDLHYFKRILFSMQVKKYLFIYSVHKNQCINNLHPPFAVLPMNEKRKNFTKICIKYLNNSFQRWNHYVNSSSQNFYCDFSFNCKFCTIEYQIQTFLTF